MSVQKYPYYIEIYKGEGRLLFVPFINHINGRRVEFCKDTYIEDVQNNTMIGEMIQELIDCIHKSALSEMTLEELQPLTAWQKNTKYRNWMSFWKNNDYALLRFYEDGSYRIFSSERSKRHKGGYDHVIKVVELPETATAEEIGQAVIDVFNAAEEYYGNQPAADTFPPKQLELIDGSMLTVKPPKDKHFEDCGDAGSAEIYQCYSYKANDDAESSADFYVGIAPELDCNLNSENIRAAWEEIYGEAEHFAVGECECGIFKLRVEMRNKQTHRISYLLQMEEDLLLECGMAVHQPNRRKKMDEKLGELFEEFVVSCTMKVSKQ